MILVRMVSATRSPTATLPANSQTEATAIACLRVRDLDETDVANELATSLAPGQGVVSTRPWSWRGSAPSLSQDNGRRRRRLTNIPSIKESKETRNRKDVIVLAKNRHVVYVAPSLPCQ